MISYVNYRFNETTLKLIERLNSDKISYSSEIFSKIRLKRSISASDGVPETSQIAGSFRISS